MGRLFSPTLSRRSSFLPLLSSFTVLLGLSGCTHGCARTPLESSAGEAPLSPIAQEQGAAAPELPLDEPEPSFAEAFRMQDFKRVARAIDQAPEHEQKQPEVRYLRAKVALALQDPETALHKLSNLEKEYPPFTPEVSALRLQAAKQSQDFTLLLHFLDGTTSPEELLLLARAAQEQGNPTSARHFAAQGLAIQERSPKTQKTPLSAELRHLLASLALTEKNTNQALEHYLWLAIHMPHHPVAQGVDQTIVSLDPQRALNDAQRLARARLFAERGLWQETEQELGKIQGTLPPGTADFTLALALYNAREDYPRAATLFAEAARKSKQLSNEALYHEARTLTRAHRTHEALSKYQALSRKTGEYTEDASFQVARMALLEGKWTQAVEAFDAYKKKYPRSNRYRSAWSREMPVARLLAGQAAAAERELFALSQSEKNQLDRARYLQLAAVASAAAGKKEQALTRYQQVIREFPLSLPALLAAARLREAGHPTPPLFEAAPEASPLPPLELQLPDKVRRLHHVGLDEAAENALRQEERSLRAQYGTRNGEALCRLYGKLHSAQRRYQIAQTAASWSQLRYAPNEQTHWQFDCIYPQPYADSVQLETTLFQVSPAFVYGVMRQESAFRPTVVSPAHAVGLMQIIPPTATRIAEELNVTYDPQHMRVPAINIRFGTYYLQKLLQFFGGRLELAAAAYNAGPHAVNHWLKHGEKLPLDLFVARIPYAETRTYVYRVLGNTARYAYLMGGSEAVPTVSLEIPPGLRAPADAY